MSLLDTIQQQIVGQLASINTTLASSAVSGNVRSNLTTSAATLQGLLDKLILGQTLSASDQAALTASLDSSQKAILAAKAQRTQWILLGVTGTAVIAITVYVLIRHHKKSKAA